MAIKIGGTTVVSDNRYFSGVGLTLTGPIYANNSTGTSGQVLQSTGAGIQWADVATGNGSGSGSYDTAITKTAYIQVNSGSQDGGAIFIGTITSSVAGFCTLTVSSVSFGRLQVGQSLIGTTITPGTKILSFGSGSGGTGTYRLDIDQTTTTSGIMSASGPDVSLVMPTDAGYKIVIESIHVCNVSNNDLYFTARQDFNGGNQVPIANKVLIPYQGAVELLEQPTTANPYDIIRTQAFVGAGATADGYDGGMDAFITYSKIQDTNYVATGEVVTNVTGVGDTVFQSVLSPSVIQSIKLINISDTNDIDVSVSIYSTAGPTQIRKGYLAYNLTIPQNSTVELCARPKRLEKNECIVVKTNQANTCGVTVGSKYIV